MLTDEQTDRELLELAAQAAGYKIAWEGGCVTGWMAGGSWWNPLTDDGDALRLAVALGLDVEMHGCARPLPYAAAVYDCDRGLAVEQEANDADPFAATRRAIVRAAAMLAKDAEAR